VVALEGQQRGLVTKAFWKLMPCSARRELVFGMYLALRSSLRMSSVRMKIMLGLLAVLARLLSGWLAVIPKPTNMLTNANNTKYL
jgi:hypothetical protein